MHLSDNYGVRARSGNSVEKNEKGRSSCLGNSRPVNARGIGVPRGPVRASNPRLGGSSAGLGDVPVIGHVG